MGRDRTHREYQQRSVCEGVTRRTTARRSHRKLTWLTAPHIHRCLLAAARRVAVRTSSIIHPSCINVRERVILGGMDSDRRTAALRVRPSRQWGAVQAAGGQGTLKMRAGGIAVTTSS